MKRLEEICIFIRNGLNIKNDKSKKGLPITRIETISNGIIDINKTGYANIFNDKYIDYYLRQDDILMSHINSLKHLGKVGYCYYDMKIIHGMNLLNIRVNPNNVYPKYLYYYFKSNNFKIKLNKISKQSVNQSSFSISDLKKIRIDIIDLERQKLIVSKLDKVVEVISIRKKQIEELNNLIKSQFVEMFGDIKIKEKVKNVSVYFSRGKTPNYVEKSNIKVISQACIYWDEFKHEKAKYQDENKALNSLEKMIENGDVLITSTGTGTLGRCNVYYGEEHKYMADSHVSILRFNYKEVNPIFFKYYFMQEKVQKELYAECVNGSTNQIELSKDRFLNFRILIPEITLQNQFSEIVKEIDKQKFEIEKSLKEIQELYESLMEKYFG